jgi:hypothetical protein
MPRVRELRIRVWYWQACHLDRKPLERAVA